MLATPGTSRAATAASRARWTRVLLGARASATVACASEMRASGIPSFSAEAWAAVQRGRRVLSASPMSSDAMTISRRAM